MGSGLYLMSSCAGAQSRQNSVLYRQNSEHRKPKSGHDVLPSACARWA